MLRSLPLSFLRQLLYRTFRVLFWGGWWLFGLAVLAWYGLHCWSGDRLVLVRLVAYLMPWLLVGLVPGLIISGLAGRRWLAATLGAPTLLIGLTFAPLFLPRSSTALATGTSFKIMSYNSWYRNEQPEAMARVIRQEQPDILLLQELTPAMAQAIQARLADLYPEGQLYFAYERRVLQGILSRYPLTPLELQVKAGRTQKVLVTTPAGPVEVWNIHANQPWPWPRQYNQLADLADEAAAIDTPLVVGGDFNTTDQSETYDLINRYLHNAHWQAGWGFGFSFPARIPRFKGIPIFTAMVRIDHIFYNDHFFASSARILPESGGSDHFPIVAELVLTES